MPELITRIWNLEKQSTLIDQEPSLILQFNQKESRNLILNLIYNEELDGKREFIRFLSIDLQKELLMTNQQYRKISIEPTQNIIEQKMNFAKQEKISQYIDQFSEDAILAIARDEKSISLEYKKNGKKYNPVLLKYYLAKLPLQTQIKLLLINSDEYAHAVSKKAIFTYVNGNPLLFDKLPEEIIQRMLDDNPELITKMPLEIQAKKQENPYSNYFNLTNFKKNPEEYKRRISAGRINCIKHPDYEYEISDIGDNELIWEMAKYEPKCIKLHLDSQNYEKRNKHLIDILYEHAKESERDNELSMYLKDIKENLSKLDDKTMEKINRIGKMLVAEDITKKITPGLMLDYAKDPTHEKLVMIVKTVYGDTAAKVLEDRPQITIELIPNFDIFKPEIIEEFRIGTLHAILTYDMSKASAILGELARKPDLMEKYKKFNKATLGMFGNTATNLDEKLEAFMDFSKIMDEVDFDRLTEKQKETLRIIMLDKNSINTPDVVGMPKTSEELNTYLDRRSMMFDEAIKKEQDEKKIKQLISRKYFGMDYDYPRRVIDLDKLSISRMCNFYNIDNFVNNKVTLESGKFNANELDALELLSIFNKITDPQILKQLEVKLHGRSDIINPLTFKALQEKVPQQYNEKMVEALITPEKAIEMAKNGEEGIRIQQKKDITVITLAGCDFKAYISNPFLDNSRVGISDRTKEFEKVWLEKENGISSISGCVIDQNETTSTVGRGEIGLGFGKINPNQILGMGITDIGMAHFKRELHSSSSEVVPRFSYNYPEEFMTKFSKRININDQIQDSSHQYNEMAIQRTERSLDEIKEGTYGGKINPDYIFVNGTEDALAIDMARKMGIKYVLVYDEKKYITKHNNRIWESSKKTEPREQSEFMRDVQETIQGGENDGR